MVYNRQEILDILRHLSVSGFLKLRCDPRIYPFGQLEPEMALMFDGEAERSVYWFVDGVQHWYAV